MLSVTDYLQAIRDMPLTCIDVLVIDSGNRLLLGKRKNRPAQGTFFAPGGRVRKGEKQQQALERISLDELSIDIPFERWTLVGVYDHIYQDNFFNARHAGSDAPVATHCITLAYVLKLGKNSSELRARFTEGMKAQHENVEWIPINEIATRDDVHDYTKDYASAFEPN
jgi:colanic acid biosynthesis protein WcaH